ncbi:hypothetical protein SCG7109_BQ_00010, partial [Chlamydiales bacterium SCGC AG-110-M15]
VIIDRGEQDAVVTLDDIAVTDPDSSNVDLVYTIQSLPNLGVLKLNNVAANVNDTFTQQDIIDAKLTYSHDVTDNLSIPNTFTYSVIDADSLTLVDNSGTDVPTATFTFAIRTLDYTENDGARIVRQDISTDAAGNIIVDHDINNSSLTNVNSAKVEITLPLSAQSFSESTARFEDALIFVDTARVKGSYDSDTGTLTLNAVSGQTPSLDDYQEAFNSVRYINRNENPIETFRTVTFTASNGVNPDFIFKQDLQVTGVEDAPTAYESGPGNALSFDGVNDHVVIPSIEALPSGSFTIEAAFRISNSPNNGISESLLSMTSVKGGADNKAIFDLAINENGEAEFTMGLKDGTVFNVVGGFANVNTWNTIAAAYDKNTGGLTLYLNENIVGFGVINPANRLTSVNNEPLQIGRYTSNTGDHNFEGLIDEVRIWDKWKPVTEIKSNINEKLTGDADNLFAYWRFDESVGIEVIDASDNGHTGYLQGDGTLETTTRAPSAFPMKTTTNAATHNVIVHSATTTEAIVIGGADPEDGDNLTVTITSIALPQGANLYQYDANSLNLADLRGSLITLTGSANILTDPGARFILQTAPGDTGQNIATIEFTVTDSAGNVSNTESVSIDSIPGNIFPVNDHVNPLNVFEGGLAELSNDRLHVIDTDTPDQLLSYLILDVPDHGEVLKDGVALNVGGRFTQQDVNEGRIAYMHDGGESIHDTFSFDVTDDAGNTTPVRVYNITIHPINDIPVGDFHPPVTVNEGAITVFNNVELHAVDYDTPDTELVYVFTKSPENGVLMNGGDVIGLGEGFTQEDVNLGLVSYHHDGSETLTDIFEFYVTDGNGGQTATQLFDIEVAAVNDAPVLMHSNGLYIDNGAEEEILDNKLFTYDADSPSDEIEYTLESLPQFGYLKKNGFGIGSGATFTQEDINEGRMSYEHDGGDSTEDSFALSIVDNEGASKTYTTFNIMISALELEDTPLTDLAGEVVDEEEVELALETISQASALTSDEALVEAVEDIVVDELAESPDALPVEIEQAVIESIIEHIINLTIEEELINAQSVEESVSTPTLIEEDLEEEEEPLAEPITEPIAPMDDSSVTVIPHEEAPTSMLNTEPEDEELAASSSVTSEMT